MELPQPRPLETEGRKPTHDFLSLYSHSTAQQDPTQSFQGGCLKTHDFLRPLERIGKTCASEETTIDVSSAEQPPQPLAPPTHNSSVEHLLPGGIGTYSISQISYFNQRVPKPEVSVFSVAQASDTDRNDDSSRCSSLSGSGFTLWEDSAVIKGKTRKENLGEKASLRAEPQEKFEQWAVSTEQPSQSSSSNHRNSYNSLSSSQRSGQKSRSFTEMLNSAVKVSSREEELDNSEVLVIKRESSSTAYKGELRINVGGKCSDQKANTPRSKHSATEQRRRSKINDRFQKLRELIPRSDQKRDKASFLLEVIEYIQFLQEKVHKYEGSYQGWYHEPGKLTPSRNNCNPAACYIDQSRGINSGPAFIFAAKSDEKNMANSPALPGCPHNAVESEISAATTFKEADHHPGTTNKRTPHPTLQPRIFTRVTSEGATTKLQSRLAYDADNKPCQVQAALCETRSCTADIAAVSNKLKGPEQIIEGGRISISSAYSQGLLNTLKRALQSSGVDMSQASVAVQIELGNRTNNRQTVPTPAFMDVAVCPSDRGIIRTGVAAAENLEQTFKKKQKT